MNTTRREFMATAAAAAVPAPAARVRPFSLRAVRLLDPALLSMARRVGALTVASG